MHIVSATALAACLVAATITASAQEDSPFTNHGVAADVSRHHGAAATVDEDGNRVLLVAIRGLPAAARDNAWFRWPRSSFIDGRPLLHLGA